MVGWEWRDCLQDGCGYNLDGACYDLGFGSNACSINKKSIEKAFNKTKFKVLDSQISFKV